ncbi:hypothetical protein EDC04DRAFT_2039171 [Pisolithus marmoratus]|nr:hypothetical protein EDC04DRAFT_2039171 [Pisolithus marmoratus]
MVLRGLLWLRAGAVPSGFCPLNDHLAPVLLSCFTPLHYGWIPPCRPAYGIFLFVSSHFPSLLMLSDVSVCKLSPLSSRPITRVTPPSKSSTPVPYFPRRIQQVYAVGTSSTYPQENGNISTFGNLNHRSVRPTMGRGSGRPFHGHTLGQVIDSEAAWLDLPDNLISDNVPLSSEQIWQLRVGFFAVLKRNR